MAREDEVILVVGGETEYKPRVAEALARIRSASEVECTKSGARHFRRKSSPEALVIDTTPLVVHENTPALATAEMWMSSNALRRLCGKLICVICVVTYSGPEDSLHLDSDFLLQKFNWLHLIGYIFRDYKQNILVSVKLLEGVLDSESIRSRVLDDLQRDGYVKSNISFENMVGKGLIPAATTLLSVYLVKFLEEGGDSTIHFRLKEVTSKCRDLDSYGPWGPQRAILLGRTGSGKSTLFQMLTKGRLDPSSNSVASSSIRGVTKEVTRADGRGWYVIDTPGFGELKDELSTISTEEAQRRIGKYVQRIEGTYSHYIYVVMKDRIDLLEKKLWRFFQLLFSGGRNFTIVVSNANPTWMEENMSVLREEFTGCEYFLCGEFPPTATDDEELEAELEEVRTESLKLLEDELASLSRYGTDCDIGFFSSRSFKRFSNEVILELREEKGLAAKVVGMPIVQVRNGVGRMAAVAKSMVVGDLAALLKENEKFVLLPH